ncbi:hypothetical protein [Leifsonia aquatica]|uniref:hypothetical protein n=1 Tax=Leifsonia aquatica TaxID=144185 RepID=UPI0004699701|nr:hypothetical protein [Leifsonia aquatica]
MTRAIVDDDEADVSMSGLSPMTGLKLRPVKLELHRRNASLTSTSAHWTEFDASSGRRRGIYLDAA